jgi:hypothetical protein
MTFKGLEFPGPPIQTPIKESNPPPPLNALANSAAQSEESEGTANALGMQLYKRRMSAGEGSSSHHRNNVASRGSVMSSMSTKSAPATPGNKRMSVGSVKSLPSSPPPKLPLPPAPKTLPMDQYQFPSASAQASRRRHSKQLLTSSVPASQNLTLTVTPSTPDATSAASRGFELLQIQAEQTQEIADLKRALHTQRARFEELSAYLLTMAEGFELERGAWERKVERLKREACGLRWLVETMGGGVPRPQAKAPHPTADESINTGLGVPGNKTRPRRSFTTPSTLTLGFDVPSHSLPRVTRRRSATSTFSSLYTVSPATASPAATDDGFNFFPPELVSSSPSESQESDENTPMNTPTLQNQQSRFDSLAQVEKRAWRDSIEGVLVELDRWQELPAYQAP